MKVFDGGKHFRATLEEYRRGPMASLAAHYGVTVPDLTSVASTALLPARLHRNQWIVDCPDCRGAEFVFLDHPLMMCQYCWNGTVGGKWRPVILPPFVQVIERVMEARPVPLNRNWEPGETVADLMAENRAHGLPEQVSS